MDKENMQVRNYLEYIRQRCIYLNIVNNGVQSNEYKFYKSLRDRIKKWGKNHLIPYQFIRGHIDINIVMQCLGISKRQCYRILEQNRKELIRFIEEQEKILEEKYPFEEGVDAFNYNEVDYVE